MIPFDVSLPVYHPMQVLTGPYDMQCDLWSRLLSAPSWQRHSCPVLAAPQHRTLASWVHPGHVFPGYHPSTLATCSLSCGAFPGVHPDHSATAQHSGLLGRGAICNLQAPGNAPQLRERVARVEG